MSNHKYVNRETGKTIYFGEEGKKIFDKRAEAATFRYVGPISKKQQAAEEAEALAAGHSDEDEEEDDEDLVEKQKAASKKTTAKVKELSAKEVEDLTEDKKIPLKKAPKKAAEKEEQPEKEEEEDDEDNEEANEKKLQEAIKNLKGDKDGKAGPEEGETKKG